MLDGGPILDHGVLDELRDATGGDEQFVRELVETYLGEAPANLAAIAAGLDSGDASAIVRPAHTLKSSSASLGAMRLSGICRAIEETARGGTLDGVAEALDAARSSWTETVSALADEGLAG